VFTEEVVGVRSLEGISGEEAQEERIKDFRKD